MEERLIEGPALEDIVRASGGIAVELVKLVRRAALHALDRDASAERIEMPDSARAIKDLRIDMSASLSRDDWRLLRQRHQDRKLSAEPEMQRLFYTGALIEYSNDVQWCDVHPVLWSLLDYYAEE